MGLVAKGPNPEQGKKVLDFLLSDDGQRHLGQRLPAPGVRLCDDAGDEERASCPTPTTRARSRSMCSSCPPASKTIGERYQKEVG